MSSPGQPSLRDEQKALTRQRLLQAAETVFATRGFCGASVDEIARRAGATTGALYSNFDGKEDLFLELFEQRTAAHIQEYCAIFDQGATPEEQVRRGADRWMQILSERPDYFPLLIEFWTYALRAPQARRRFADRFAVFRASITQQVFEGAVQRGIPMTQEMAERLGLVINALSNGIALEKLIDPEGVPDELFGDVLVLLATALETLASQTKSTSSDSPTPSNR
jgi:AcrR family transcriptional regulator